MRASSQFIVALGFATALVAAAANTANAHKWRSIGECYGTVEGLASSTGILGLGTARAREAARSDWETKVANKYGPTFANLDRARRVQWDCKKNALVLAKCVVIADPCASRISG